MAHSIVRVYLVSIMLYTQKNHYLVEKATWELNMCSVNFPFNQSMKIFSGKRNLLYSIACTEVLWHGIRCGWYVRVISVLCRMLLQFTYALSYLQNHGFSVANTYYIFLPMTKVRAVFVGTFICTASKLVDSSSFTLLCAAVQHPYAFV